MKKGISLIVLVITIIIIIILAGAVILNLNNNNPMDSANKAALLQEDSDFRSGAALWMSNIIVRTKENPFIVVSSKESSITAWPTSDTTSDYTSGNFANINKADAETFDLLHDVDSTTGKTKWVDLNGADILGGYYDLDHVLVIPWTTTKATTTTTGEGADAVTTTTGTNGTLILDRNAGVTSYEGITAAVGMTPSKAGRNNQYKIAMNANGNTMFYTDRTTLTNKNASR